MPEPASAGCPGGDAVAVSAAAAASSVAASSSAAASSAAGMSGPSAPRPAADGGFSPSLASQAKLRKSLFTADPARFSAQTKKLLRRRELREFDDMDEADRNNKSRPQNRRQWLEKARMQGKMRAEAREAAEAAEGGVELAECGGGEASGSGGGGGVGDGSVGGSGGGDGSGGAGCGDGSDARPAHGAAGSACGLHTQGKWREQQLAAGAAAAAPPSQPSSPPELPRCDGSSGPRRGGYGEGLSLCGGGESCSSAAADEAAPKRPKTLAERKAELFGRIDESRKSRGEPPRKVRPCVSQPMRVCAARCVWVGFG